MTRSNSEPQFIKIPLEKIEFPDYNPREISNKDFKKLCADIKKDPNFLMQRPPLINHITKDNRYVCYAGNQRGKAAIANGDKDIWVWVENDVPRKLQDERMLRDNLHRGEWDWSKLMDFDVTFLRDSGFELDELGPMFGEKNKVREDGFNVEKEIAEIKDPRTKPGDVYVLGDHRLMCGSSKNEEDVDVLMGGELADILYCDPPYNIGLSYDKGSKPNKIKKRYTNAVFSDNMSNADYLAWLLKIVDNGLNASKENLHVFFWCDPRYIGIVQDAFRHLKVSNKSVCFWLKNQFNPVTQMAFNRLIEPCVYGTRGKPFLNDSFRNLSEILNSEISGRNIFNSLMDYTDTWAVSREVSQEYIHPTQKPCTLHEKPLNRCTTPGQVVLDLFGGSGSTLMTCEQMGRRARLMELDPVFCDAIVNRWERFTGKKAKLLSKTEPSLSI